MNSLNDNAFSYSELLNEYTINATTLSTNSLTVTNLTPNRFVGSDTTDRLVTRSLLGTTDQVTVTDNSNNSTLSLPQSIAVSSAVTFGDITDSGLSASSIVATDDNKKLINRTITGTTDQVNINTVGTTTTFSLPQSIATTSTPTFADITDSGLSASSIVATDANKKLINRTITGTTDQVNISTVGTTTTFSLPQSIATTSTPTFADITDSALSINSLVATDANKKLINRTLQGTTNQVNISTVGTTTTFSLPQSVAITSDVSFNSINLSNLSANSIIATDGSKTLTNRTLQGTTNQVNISTSGTTTTLSTPQNIDVTATPQFATMKLTGLTASKVMLTDASKNIISSSLGESDLVTIGSVQTITGNKSFSGTTNLTSLTASKILLTDASKNIVSSSHGQSDLVLTSSDQIIAGNKIFTNSPVVESAGAAYIRVKTTGQSGFDFYTFGDSGGCGVWSVGLGGSILKLKNALTANRILTTDSDNYLASASIGTSDLVLTSGNQTIANTKTFSGTVNLSGLTASRHLALDASKNIITVTDPGTNLLSSNNTWTGTNTYSNDIAINYSNKLYMYGTAGEIFNIGINTITGGLGVIYNLGKVSAHSFRAGNAAYDSLTIGRDTVSTKNNTLDNGSGNMTITGSATIAGGASVAGSATVTGNTTISGLTSMVGGATISGGLLTIGSYVYCYGSFGTITIASGGTGYARFSNIHRISNITTSNSQNFVAALSGHHLVTFGVRLTSSPTAEFSIWVEESGNTGIQYGQTQLSTTNLYASGSATIYITSGNNFSIKMSNAGSAVTIADLNATQISIKYISS